jgi:hypothetical protein
MPAEEPEEPEENNEYELEPVDPEILRSQQERAKRKTREAEDAIDINAVFDQAKLGDPIDYEKLQQFRFTTRHLLIATGLFALFMTLWVRLGGCLGPFVAFAIALCSGWWFVVREERRRIAQIELLQKRHQQRVAAQRAAEDGHPAAGDFDPALDQTLDDDPSAQAPAFRFSFSTRELLLSFVVAAVLLGLANLFGFETAALLVGALALVGLLMQALGIALPPLVVLGWWLLLVLYILMSLWSTLGPAGEA